MILEQRRICHIEAIIGICNFIRSFFIFVCVCIYVPSRECIAFLGRVTLTLSPVPLFKSTKA